MELAFVSKTESGWRGRGAPRKHVPNKVLDMLRHTDTTDEVGVIDIRGDSDADVAEMKSYLRAGARQMGRTLRLQHDEENDQIRFQLAPRRNAR
jgi:hypothetical protein